MKPLSLEQMAEWRHTANEASEAGASYSHVLMTITKAFQQRQEIPDALLQRRRDAAGRHSAAMDAVHAFLGRYREAV